MGTELEWEGHKIIIHSQPSIKHLLTTGETVVIIDDVQICRSGGGFSFNEKANGVFLHNNHPTQLTLEIKPDLITFTTVPYRLTIDGVLTSVGRAEITNWQLFLIPIAILLSVAVYIIVK